MNEVLNTISKKWPLIIMGVLFLFISTQKLGKTPARRRAIVARRLKNLAMKNAKRKRKRNKVLTTVATRRMKKGNPGKRTQAQINAARLLNLEKARKALRRLRRKK